MEKSLDARLQRRIARGSSSGPRRRGAARRTSNNVRMSEIEMLECASRKDLKHACSETASGKLSALELSVGASNSHLSANAFESVDYRRKVCVRVPSGCGPGDNITANLDKTWFSLTVPRGKAAGDTVRFLLDPDGGTNMCDSESDATGCSDDDLSRYVEAQVVSGGRRGHGRTKSERVCV